MALRAIAAFSATVLGFVFASCSSGPATVEEKMPEGPPVIVPDLIGMGGTVGYGDEGPIRRYTNATRTNYAHPDVSLDGSWLAYAATISGQNPHIYVQRKGEFAARQLTQGPSSNIHPAISPDGTEIAWSSNAGDGRFTVFIQAMAGHGGRELVSDEGWTAVSPTWSADGRKLAYAACRNPAADAPLWEIKIHDRNNMQTLTLAEGTAPSWSPDGSRIVFQRLNRNMPGYTSIYTMRPDGSELTEIHRSDDYGCITPSWLGSEWILFATVNKSKASRLRMNDEMFNADDIYMIKRDGTQLRMVTSHRLADWDPCYDLSTGEVIYVSNRDGVQNIFGMKSNVSDPWGVNSHVRFGGGH